MHETPKKALFLLEDLEAARMGALEEAARLAETIFADRYLWTQERRDGARLIADRIRGLKEDKR